MRGAPSSTPDGEPKRKIFDQDSLIDKSEQLLQQASDKEALKEALYSQFTKAVEYLASVPGDVNLLLAETQQTIIENHLDTGFFGPDNQKPVAEQFDRLEVLSEVFEYLRQAVFYKRLFPRAQVDLRFYQAVPKIDFNKLTDSNIHKFFEFTDVCRRYGFKYGIYLEGFKLNVKTLNFVKKHQLYDWSAVIDTQVDLMGRQDILKTDMNPGQIMALFRKYGQVLQVIFKNTEDHSGDEKLICTALDLYNRGIKDFKFNDIGELMFKGPSDSNYKAVEGANPEWYQNVLKKLGGAPMQSCHPLTLAPVDFQQYLDILESPEAPEAPSLDPLDALIAESPEAPTEYGEFNIPHVPKLAEDPAGILAGIRMSMFNSPLSINVCENLKFLIAEMVKSPSDFTAFEGDFVNSPVIHDYLSYINNTDLIGATFKLKCIDGEIRLVGKALANVASYEMGLVERRLIRMDRKFVDIDEVVHLSDLDISANSVVYKQLHGHGVTTPVTAYDEHKGVDSGAPISGKHRMFEMKRENPTFSSALKEFKAPRYIKELGGVIQKTFLSKFPIIKFNEPMLCMAGGKAVVLPNLSFKNVGVDEFLNADLEIGRFKLRDISYMPISKLKPYFKKLASTTTSGIKPTVDPEVVSMLHSLPTEGSKERSGSVLESFNPPRGKFKIPYVPEFDNELKEELAEAIYPIVKSQLENKDIFDVNEDDYPSILNKFKELYPNIVSAPPAVKQEFNVEKFLSDSPFAFTQIIECQEDGYVWYEETSTGADYVFVPYTSKQKQPSNFRAIAVPNSIRERYSKLHTLENKTLHLAAENLKLPGGLDYNFGEHTLTIATLLDTGNFDLATIKDAFTQAGFMPPRRLKLVLERTSVESWRFEAINKILLGFQADPTVSLDSVVIQADLALTADSLNQLLEFTKMPKLRIESEDAFSPNILSEIPEGPFQMIPVLSDDMKTITISIPDDAAPVPEAELSTPVTVPVKTHSLEVDMIDTSQPTSLPKALSKDFILEGNRLTLNDGVTRLTDDQAKALATMKNVKRLDMNGLTELSEDVATAIATMENVEYLQLSGFTKGTNLSAALEGKPKLITLDLGKLPTLSPAVVTAITKMESLEHLNLSGLKNLPLGIVNALANKESLGDLFLNGLTELSEDVATAIAQMISLKHLELSGLTKGTNLAAALADKPKLIILDLDKLSTLSPEAAQAIAKMENLKSLGLKMMTKDQVQRAFADISWGGDITIYCKDGNLDLKKANRPSSVNETGAQTQEPKLERFEPDTNEAILKAPKNLSLKTLILKEQLDDATAKKIVANYPNLTSLDFQGIHGESIPPSVIKILKGLKKLKYVGYPWDGADKLNLLRNPSILLNYDPQVRRRKFVKPIQITSKLLGELQGVSGISISRLKIAKNVQTEAEFTQILGYKPERLTFANISAEQSKAFAAALSKLSVERLNKLKICFNCKLTQDILSPFKVVASKKNLKHLDFVLYSKSTLEGKITLPPQLRFRISKPKSLANLDQKSKVYLYTDRRGYDKIIHDLGDKFSLVELSPNHYMMIRKAPSKTVEKYPQATFNAKQVAQLDSRSKDEITKLHCSDLTLMCGISYEDANRLENIILYNKDEKSVRILGPLTQALIDQVDSEYNVIHIGATIKDSAINFKNKTLVLNAARFTNDFLGKIQIGNITRLILWTRGDIYIDKSNKANFIKLVESGKVFSTSLLRLTSDGLNTAARRLLKFTLLKGGLYKVSLKK